MPNATQPSNGAADVRLSPDAAAVLETLRAADRPLTVGGVYLATPAIPAEGNGLGRERAAAAIRELYRVGLADWALDRHGNDVYTARPVPPPAEPDAVPLSDDARAAADRIRTALGNKRLTGTELFLHDVGTASGFIDALVTLVQTGEVVREPDPDTGVYTYHLAAPPPAPPLPTVTDDELAWLHLIATNEPFKVDAQHNTDCTGEVERCGLSVAGLITTEHSLRFGYRLTDLGRRVLEANG